MHYPVLLTVVSRLPVKHIKVNIITKVSDLNYAVLPANFNQKYLVTEERET